jgi:hypothetical protein
MRAIWVFPEQYHHERRQPGDEMTRSNKELEAFAAPLFHSSHAEHALVALNPQARVIVP